MVFSSISRGRCFGFGVGVVLDLGLSLFFYSLTPYSPLSLPGMIFSSMVWICFKIFVLSIQKVGVLVWIWAWCWFLVWFGFFHSLTPYSPLSPPGIIFSSILKCRYFGLDLGLVLILGLGL